MPESRPALFDEIIARLHEAAAGRIDWPEALDVLACYLDAWQVQLLSFDKAGRLVSDHTGGPAPLKSRFDYLRVYHRIDPRTAPMLALPVGAWFHDHRHFDDTFVATDPFYQQYLLPHGGRWLSGTMVLDDGALLSMLVIQRSGDRQPLDGAEVAALDRIRRFLARALITGRQQQVMRPALSAGRVLLEQFRFATMLIDGRRHVRFTNSAARELLAEGAHLREEAGLLLCRHPADDRRFGELLAELALDLPAPGAAGRVPEGDGASPDGVARQGPAQEALARDGGSSPEMRRFMRIDDPANNRSIGVFIMPLRPQSTQQMFGLQGLAMLAIHDPQARPEIDPEIVAEAFGLSPAEAEVAVLLAGGLTLEMVAARKKVGLATVRTQVKSLFAKTGTRRQAELVRIVTALPEMRVPKGGVSGGVIRRPPRRRG